MNVNGYPCGVWVSQWNYAPVEATRQKAPPWLSGARGAFHNSSELITGRASDALALCQHQRVLPLSAGALLPLSQNSARDPQTVMKLAVEPDAVEEAAIYLAGL